jgi:peptidoglycan/xylan/chitin deacetylase (PgdA/CDA1 family)
LFRYSGLPSLIRALLVRDRATIIFYHDPQPEVVERHLQYLAKHYRFETLDRVVDAIRRKDWTGIRRHSLVVTIDDGHRGNARLGELFARYGVRPTIYLCSQIVGTERQFWFRLPGVRAGESKPLPNAKRLAELKRRFDWDPLTVNAGQRHALSLDELKQLQPHVDFGSHTRFHPILTTCSDAESREEIALSKQEIEAMLGSECRHFSYPNGDYTVREANFAREAGYVSARTVDLGWNGPDTDPYRLKMTGVSDDASVSVLACQVVGFPTYFGRLMKGCVRGGHPVTRPIATP